MSRIPTLLFACFLAFSIPALSPAQNTIDVPTMDSRELVPGMRGYGLSVFSGTKPEKFDVEILGVVPNWWSGGDMILAELSHPTINDHGVVAGMSGSPVYINGKLIGAVAYGWGFSNRPVGGITPIAKMNEVYKEITLEPQLPDTEWTDSLTYWPEARAAMGLPQLDLEQLPAELTARLGMTQVNAAQGLQRLTTPLFISSQSPLVMEQVNRMFAPLGFQAVQGSGGGGGRHLGKTDPRYKDLEPENGGAVADVMVDGDLQMAGIGTITFVGEDRFVAYGHAGYGTGNVDSPVAVAEITTIIPSINFPFKIGFPVKEVGAMRQDRQFAVGAHREARSRMIPFSVNVKSGVLSQSQSFNYEMVNDRQMTPMLAMVCMLESAVSVSKLGGPMTVESTYTVNLTNGRSIKKRHYHSGNGMVFLQSASQMMNEIGTLMNNRFEKVSLDSIEATVEIGERRQIMVLDRVIEKKTTVFPGEALELEVVYTRFREPEVRIPVSMMVPRHLPAGNYELQILDAAARVSAEIAANPELAVVDSFDELVDRVEPHFSQDRVYFLLVGPESRLIVEGARQQGLPSSIAQLTESTARESGTLYRGEGRLIDEKTSKAFEAQISGTEVITITVKERN